MKQILVIIEKLNLVLSLDHTVFAFDQLYKKSMYSIEINVLQLFELGNQLMKY